MRRIWLVCAALAGCVSLQIESPSGEIENLVAFTRLYGYVRYFHPSDEAASIDWDRFAAYGAGQVRNAADRGALRRTLEQLFLPIAPSLRIYDAGDAPPATQRLILDDAGDLKIVAWQHYGAGLGETGTLYKSVRLNRPPPPGPGLGKNALESVAKPLFMTYAQPGDVVEKRLSAGLMAQIPLAVYSDASGTLPRGDASALRDALAAMDLPLRAERVDVRVAAVLIAWNAIQHFYPYFDVVDVDWESELTVALRRALQDQTSPDVQKTLRRMLAAIDDGHANVYRTDETVPWCPPFRAAWIEGRVVIVEASDTLFRSGDVVVIANGQDALARVAEEEKFFSGSPQWKRSRVLREFACGAEGAAASFLLERDGARLVADTTLNHRDAVPRAERQHIVEIRPGIWYVDLTTTSRKQLDAELEHLAHARGVIFDVRGYPTDAGAGLVPHLLAEPESDKWMLVPQISRPDHEGATHNSLGWGLKPLEPRITGRTVFLTDGSAISYAESVLGYVEGMHLGEIVGGPTAGANGNIRIFGLPGGLRVIFTGMKVTKHDGKQHHRVGIQPTVTVEPTIEGIRADRDEVLEKALALIAR